MNIKPLVAQRAELSLLHLQLLLFQSTQAKFLFFVLPMPSLNVFVPVRFHVGLFGDVVIPGTVVGLLRGRLDDAVFGERARVHRQPRVTRTATARRVSAGGPSPATGGQAVGLRHEHESRHRHYDHAESHQGDRHGLVPDRRRVQPGQEDLGLAVAAVHQVGVDETARALVVAGAAARQTRVVAVLAP